MNTAIVTVLLVSLGCIAALPGLRTRRDSNAQFFDLPSNASLVLGGITTGFDCADRSYGYYADEANACAIFHVCLPYIDNDVYYNRHFSFMCGPGTVFDQQRLICDFPENALPCSETANYLSSNAYFGDVTRNFLE